MGLPHTFISKLIVKMSSSPLTNWYAPQPPPKSREDARGIKLTRPSEARLPRRRSPQRVEQEIPDGETTAHGPILHLTNKERRRHQTLYNFEVFLLFSMYSFGAIAPLCDLTLLLKCKRQSPGTQCKADTGIMVFRSSLVVSHSFLPQPLSRLEN